MAKTQFTQRERIALIAGAVAVVFMTASLLLQKPIRAYRQSEEQVVNARLRLQDAYNLGALIEQQQQEQEQYEELLGQGAPGQSLTLMINDVLQQTDLLNKSQFAEQNASAIGREESRYLETVSLTLQGVSLKELVDLLHAMYARNNLLILERLDYLKPAPSDQGLEVSMVFSAVKET